MTAVSPAGETPAKPARPARRGPADLPFTFPNVDLARTLAAERSEPDWLLAERVAAAAAYEGLPLEKNQLYTTYVDLRSSDLTAVRPYVRTAAAPGPEAATTVPEGVAAFIELREDRVTGLALSDQATAAGVALEAFGAALARDPDGFRTSIEGGVSLPVDDKLAQLARSARRANRYPRASSQAHWRSSSATGRSWPSRASRICRPA